MGDPTIPLMVTSVYDWILAQKYLPRTNDKDVNSGNEDVLVRILKSLDQMASKAPIPST